jgi:1-acyl-sn-glycerol-3-phosphate acyltransferase
MGLQMLFALRMSLMGLHFILAGVLGVLLGCVARSTRTTAVCARAFMRGRRCVFCACG